MSTKQKAVVVGALTLAATFVPSIAGANPSTDGRDFGQHVAHCAQTVSFDGGHNPGVHRGIAGWDALDVC